MGVVTGFAHVKIPVTDLKTSTAWYRALLELEPGFEFVENGVLRGVGLVDRSTGVRVSLRERAFCVGAPDLTGFDIVAFRLPTQDALDDFIAHCRDLGLDYTYQDRGTFGAAIDVPDPDGTIVRFIFDRVEPETFVGLEFDDTGYLGSYDTPQLP
ncbi:VOC family protein [Nocardia sp. 2]|uniref:VOC family protein n=1 Tax=Nocardia acididurans TaxID=2802282 RepID=A0ABS1MDM9_9NOCA|nr:VOC family protein [Nocardia acididurans]MBL1078770.1 VOC family protein [Nocardia acididurans]